MAAINIKVTEPQGEFMQLDCPYGLFVAGFGAGKSETLINKAILDASSSPNALIALYAPTYDLVKLILAQRLVEKLTDFGLDFTYNKSDNRVDVHTPGFGSFIMRTLDKPERIVGYESYRAHIDEIDTLKMDKAEEAWNKIIARNRQSPRGLKNPVNRVCAYTTPEGFNFVYNRWVKNSTERYKYVQASTRSNVFMQNLDEYIAALEATYPPELVKAYIEGEFVNLSGGNVYSAYDRVAHRSTESIREGETLYIGMDFNVTQMAATIYVRRAGGHEWHAVDELVDVYDTPDMIKVLKERHAGHKIVVYPDASGGSRKTVDASISDIALLEQAGFTVRAHKSNPMVKDRIIAMNSALSHGRIFINDTACKRTAECLEQQGYDKNGEPDKKSGNDHQNDATTYPIVYEMPVRKPVANMNFKFYK